MLLLLSYVVTCITMASMKYFRVQKWWDASVSMIPATVNKVSISQNHECIQYAGVAKQTKWHCLHSVQLI